MKHFLSNLVSPKVLLSACCLWVLQPAGFAQYDTFTGSGNWNKESLWSDGLPTVEDNVYIGNTAPGFATVLTNDTVSLSASIGTKSQGSVTVMGSGAVWQNSGTLKVGEFGQGELEVAHGGKVTADKIQIGLRSTGTGHLSLVGTSTRGVVETKGISEGFGSGTFTLNGGLLRATGNSNSFIAGFEAGDVILGKQGGVIDSNGFSIRVTSALQGPGQLLKQGSGFLSLEKANTFAGTKISGGTLRILKGGSIDHPTKELYAGYAAGESGILTIDSGAWVRNRNALLGIGSNAAGAAFVKGTWTNDGDLRLGDQGTGILIVQAGGLVSADKVRLAGSSTGAGAIRVEGNSIARGVLETDGVVKGSGKSYVRLQGGVLRASVDNKSFSSAPIIFSGEGGTIDTNGHNIGISLDMTGNGAMTKAGEGTLTLRGINTFQGTKINEGTLRIAEAGAIGYLENSTVVGNLAGDTGALVIDTGATLTNEDALVGNIRQSKGTVQLDGRWFSHGSLTVGEEGTGTVNVRAGGYLYAPTIGLGDYGTGDGSITVSGSGDKRGTIEATTIAVGDGAAKLTLNGGIVRPVYATDLTISGFKPGDLNLGSRGAIFDTGTRNITVNSSIGGDGRLTKIGTGALVLNGNNTYKGGIWVKEGSLKVGSGGTSGSVSGNIINDGGVYFQRSDNVVYAGKISGSGGVNSWGSGKLVLKGENSYRGGTYISNGTLMVGNLSALGTELVRLDSGSLATNGEVHQIIIHSDFNWNQRGRVSLTLSPDANSERISVGGYLHGIHQGMAADQIGLVFDLKASGLPAGNSSHLVMTLGTGFGAYTADFFHYVTNDSSINGKFRINGDQLWFDNLFYAPGTGPGLGETSEVDSTWGQPVQSGISFVSSGANGGIYSSGATSYSGSVTYDVGSGLILSGSGGLTIGGSGSNYNYLIDPSLVQYADLNGNLTIVNSSTIGGIVQSGGFGSVSAVPEPSTWALFGLGGLFILWKLRSRGGKAARA